MKNLYILESEKNRILKLHKSFLLEEPTSTGGGGEAAIAAAGDAPTPPPPPTVADTTISQLQKKLGIGSDGKLGTDTAKAILAKLGITVTATTPTKAATPAKATTGGNPQITPIDSPGQISSTNLQPNSNAPTVPAGEGELKSNVTTEY
jgi:hypothetical protein